MQFLVSSYVGPYLTDILVHWWPCWRWCPVEGLET